MPLIEIETHTTAPIHRVFDLARSIDAHMMSTEDSDERAVAGRMAEGLFLTSYMKRFLVKRAKELKRMAESDEWQRYLPTQEQQDASFDRR